MSGGGLQSSGPGQEDKIRKTLKIAVSVLVAILVLPVVLGLALKAMNKDVPPPGQMIDVGGYRLHIHCTGPENELPTVVMETGSGEPSPMFHWIQSGLSETTRVCAYDRAGIGWSDESDLPRDSRTINQALHTLLNKADIKRPFVFVGHSIAGLYNRDYIERYPGEVIALALLDPSHPDQGEAMDIDNARFYPAMKKQISFLQKLISLGLTELYDPTAQGRDYELMLKYPPPIRGQLRYLSKKTETYDGFLAEFRDFEKAARQASQNSSLGDMPLLIVSAGTPQSDEGWPEEIDSEEITLILQDLHSEMESLSTKSTRVTIDPADHMSLILNRDYAEQTVPHIRKLVLEAAERMQP